MLRDDLVLDDADAAGLAAGRNIALIGEELVQFATATPIGGKRWRLDGLTRGLRGTDWATGAHRAGEGFAVIDPGAMVTIALPVEAAGRAIRLLATGVGDGAGPAAAAAAMTGASVVPPAPVHLAWDVPPGGGWRLGWTRRSRAGWAWTDAIDAPLIEEREAYGVTILSPDGAAQVHATDSATLTLPTPPAPGSRIAVRQIGTLGASRAATIIYTGESA